MCVTTCNSAFQIAHNKLHPLFVNDKRTQYHSLKTTTVDETPRCLMATPTQRAGGSSWEPAHHNAYSCPTYWNRSCGHEDVMRSMCILSLLPVRLRRGGGIDAISIKNCSLFVPTRY